MPDKLTLRELLGKDLVGFSLQTAYSLQLDHGLMGYFPAINRTNKGIVITISRELIEKVWRGMSPRRSKLDTFIVLYDDASKTAYNLYGIDTHLTAEESLSIKKEEPVLTEDEFTSLTKGGAFPFQWAPGLVAKDMSREEFAETIEAALAKL
jgi:hypothetical protein